ncbi:NUDIX hydrolase [Halostella litorea]|uniref:NUDIX hydrolase n=1 Tax=Halostella litorea TaxID=2528831 RepID=UPI0010930694|nr:NUDIX domain-containing protein [Halostella litorea]
MGSERVRYVPKVCAYVTRGGGSELLVFEGPDHAGLQVPKGTVEPGETLQEALLREVKEESGLDLPTSVDCVARDIWARRQSKYYVRHFYHATVKDTLDTWTHVVTGDGDEAGKRFEYSWVDLPADRGFALDLDDYVGMLPSPVKAVQ